MAETNQNLLLENVKKCNITQARLLLDRGADPNYINEEEGVSPMHLAAGLGVEPLCLLLQYNGDPNIRLGDGTTPVHVAAIWGFADCMHILLANGGDPYLKDQDGLSAEDLAIEYQHDDVLQVLQQFMFVLSSAEEQTMTPMFTYKRLSFESGSSGSPGDCDENCSEGWNEHDSEDSMYNTQRLEDYLHQFARRRRSSMFLRNVQKQVDRYFGNGQKTHLVDVTSPDHPYIEPRSMSPEEQFVGSPDDSLHSRLSPSDTSGDSFVTCDGESFDSVQKKEDSTYLSSPDVSPLSTHQINTVIKNPKYHNHEDKEKLPCRSRNLFQEVENSKCHSHEDIEKSPHGHRNMFLEVNSQNFSNQTSDKSYKLNTNNSEKKRSGEYRRTKYSHRKLPLPQQSQDLYFTNEKCDFCGGIAEKHIVDGTVCATCEKLGLELDELVGASLDYNNSAGLKQDVLDSVEKLTETVRQKLDSLPDLLETLPETAQCKGGKKNWLLAERSAVFERDKKLHVNEHLQEGDEEIEQNASKHKSGNGQDKSIKRDFERDLKSEEVTDLTRQFKNTHLDFGMPRHSRTSNKNRKSTALENSNLCGIDDSIVSHISSTVNELDKAQLFNDSVLTMDETFLDRVESVPENSVASQFGHVSSFSVQRDYEKKTERDIDNEVEIETGENKENIGQEYNDLWKQVQECKHEKLARRNRKDILDTGFCGRQSMSSMFSDASTVDYVYTDKENGITLVERHLPSLCGSQGSRRSVDSQFSVNTNLAVNSDSGISRNRSNRCSLSSEDTVLYNWRENAMLKSNDSGNGSSETATSTPLSQDLLKLDNQTLRSKLCGHGDDPGPVTNTTRQAYLTRLNQLENDKNNIKLTHKAPEYPAELRIALNGNLDMSEMPNLETKMVAAFQNPDRLRRWREGTLKSSFNYILLDPRITKNLPNRAVNMSDQDVFQTFISATFYIGKGKRARPYCHLYEAIKQQKKNGSKMSKKVEKILEIWSCGMGVVSLHCFQSVIPVEAYTREACMIDAIGLKQITNQKKGDYYGVSVTFSMKERRKMGVYLLKKALQIFLAEGERQIAPLDIKKD
ncbi:uncharacterized protein LOC123565473 [Mercenaria mercenaria]|uniref:uncharacterized protein LOC123565473 n=1 Tax=Mercenaria mercenaria TaxID=6596 RepID=UPI00234F1750|nr:uncharacterized protein LOC123565473 [Mercenaria mercenaria]